ncbi:tetratricopeptide repeat protein [Legionella maceachernii]|uniref:Enhanced entry protein EnhC n=1 Tax=Legionella maceachernii TaxID=466 RepID=A0A0W0WGC1_9GAMM|nr:SEL1-like repeat protein [Legionella maceachernii]KTD31094.1 enhanced entry protein EnhC [Legionella maceachernii]SJZ98653.1 enhanced entry protein EnhC [Legionella maceachernii]SUP01174.1 Sel1 repeat [Legionella maceachernii]
MKSFVPWFYLVAATGGQFAFAANGLDAYRQGNYPLAAQTLLSESGKDPVADYYMGRMRLYGYGQLKNNNLALRYFNQAAEKGMLPAQQLLARYNLIEEKNPEKALYWFKKAAAAGDVQAQMYCAAAYLFGLGTKENSDTARKYYIDAAKAGNALAQYTLGMHFLESRDQRNKKLGAVWLTKAADQGFTEAQAKLGELYANGSVVTRDNNKAVDLLMKAAAQNSSSAMTTLGELAIKQNQIETGKDWLTKAANAHNGRAAMSLARLYLDQKSSIYNPQTGFMWTLQAAQNGSGEAQQALALLYKEGKGVAMNPQLAEQWELKAKATLAKKDSEVAPAIEAARWLSNGKTDNFTDNSYSLGGIYSAWQNPLALKENNYNSAPQMETVSRAEIYKPNFTMVQPSEIPINDYFDLIAPMLNANHVATWTFPRYPLDKQIEALQANESLALEHKPRQSMVDEGSPYPEKPGPQDFNYFKEKTVGWENKANYQSVLNQLYGQAILGDSSAQFEIGQLYQYGIAVNKSPQQAIIYYQLSAAQQEVRAEYNLGILYLEGQTNPVDYKQGISWMTDAAFKGNVYAQYVLANIYDKGFTDANGTMIVEPDMQQALAMYYLASSNGYGPAQYRLAEYLVKQKQAGLSVVAKQNRTKLIRRLYQGAVNQGVVEAELPLAYYNAMDSANPEKQLQAFNVAQKAAKEGNSEAALLLGMMYERGIAVPANQVEALYWYQQAALNPVNAFILGTYYSQGIGLGKDMEKGRALLQQAADAGFSYASLNLAILKHEENEAFLDDLSKARDEGNSIASLLLADYYLAQANDPSNMQLAQDIYQNLADKGDKDAQLKLGYLYDTGLAGKLDRELAARWYLASAEQGQPVAQYLLGQLYQLGRIGKEPDYAEAKKWYTAAQTTYPKAAVALGFIYDTVEDDYLKALESYQLAAQKDDPVGEYDLALIYEKGKGLPVDYAKAQELFTKAADKGYSDAMTQLADMYFTGQGIARNDQKALQLYKKAADLGDPDALYQLGLLSETGVATKLDFGNAVNYYHKAAEKGNEKAKLALARMYQYGLGVNQDSEQAKQLYGELAANNNAYAQYQLALMLFNTSPERKSDEGKRLLQQASENGSLQARKMLQWLDAQQQERISFIEPISISQTPVLAGQQPADLMYFDALSEWNRGDEDLSRRILKRLMIRFPQYTPAKRAYEQLNQHSSSLSLVYNERSKPE